MTAPGDRLTLLDDYASGHMPDTDAGSFEEELFATAAAGRDAELSFHEGLRRNATWLAARGGFDAGATREQVQAILASGSRVHFTDLGPPGVVSVPGWAADVELVIMRLGVDLRGYTDVNVDVVAPDGATVKTFRDVGYDPEEGAIYAVCEEPLARLSFQRGRILARITGVRDGHRDTVAVYDSTPGPER